jgi:hypothetical protein
VNAEQASKCAAGTRVSGIVDAAIFVNKLIGRWW